MVHLFGAAVQSPRDEFPTHWNDRMFRNRLENPGTVNS
jgi:hypothetical protein